MAMQCVLFAWSGLPTPIVVSTPRFINEDAELIYTLGYND